MCICKRIAKKLFYKLTSKSYVLRLGNQCDTPKIGDFRGENCRGSKITTNTYFTCLQ